MKTSIGLAAVSLLLAVSACVPTSKFQQCQKATADNQRKIEAKNVEIKQLKTNLAELQADIDDCKRLNGSLAQDTALAGVRNRTLSNRLDVLQNDLAALAAKMGDVPEYRSLMRHLSQMQDELASNTDQLISSNRSLEQQKAALAQAQKDLNESAEQLSQSNAALATKTQQVAEQQREIEGQQEELRAKQAEIERQAKQLQELESQLKSKDEAMAALKTNIANALTDFDSDELTVVHKDGKVYVSLEEKLLFASGQYEVNNKGISAIRKIAAILKDVSADVDIAVEGHTDNVPLRGSVIQDNWDLSAKRATSVLRVLVAGGVPQSRLHAIGRADTAPVADNATEEGRCKNRRTEIVLTPKIDQILKAIN